MPDQLRIEIRSKRLRGGRLVISADTTRRKVKEAREAAVRALLERGDILTIERLRRRELGIADVEAAHRNDGLAALEKASLAATPGAPRSDHRPTVSKAVDRVLRTIKGTRELGTYKTFASVGKQLKDRFGRRALDDITEEEAEAFLHEPKPRRGKDKEPKPWAAHTQGHVRSFARRVWKKGGATTQPWADVEVPRRRATRHAFLQPAEWRALADSLEGTPRLAAFALGALAGLREGEIVNLRTDIDVDLAACVVRIQARGGECPWKPKTDNSEADVAFPRGGELHRILTAHAAAGYAGARYFLRLPKQDRPMSSTTLIGWAKKAYRGVGLRYGREGDGLTVHSLRHTFGSWMAQRDVQLLKIANLMRDTPEVVARFYAHLLPKDLRGAMDVIDQCAKNGKSDFCPAESPAVFEAGSASDARER